MEAKSSDTSGHYDALSKEVTALKAELAKLGPSPADAYSKSSLTEEQRTKITKLAEAMSKPVGLCRVALEGHAFDENAALDWLNSQGDAFLKDNPALATETLD